MNILIVQHISVWWTKASRGAPLAATRNAVPSRLALPTRPPVPAATTVLHEARYGERGGFQPRETFTADPDIAACLSALCITAGRSDEGAWVSYDYSRECGGAPNRDGTRKTLKVFAGQWASIAANGRFSPGWDGDWWYEKHVVNVGLFAEFVPTCFLDSQPIASAEFMGALW